MIMLRDETNQTTAAPLRPVPVPEMVSCFIEELRQGCERYNDSGHLISYDLCELSEGCGIVRYKNLYCQYELSDHSNRSLMLSVGWHGSGFHLMAMPDLEFMLVRNQWREKSNPMLVFDSSRELALFCMNELRHHAECLQSRTHTAAQTEFTPYG
jgi:hypothetical protein